MSGRPEACVAVVGAGPAGCYAAQALRKKLPDAEIVIFDRLPVPYGLLRYGVAADHQGTKAVSTQFERLFTRGGIEFRGGVALDDALSLEHLLDAFDAVVLATGLSRDRRLGVPGDERVLGSGRLTRALNSHPDEYDTPPTVGRRVAIVGAGNIAADLLRLLLRARDEWTQTDMDADVLERIVPQPATSIDVLVRGGAADARWDASMVRELGNLARPWFRVAGDVPTGDDDRSAAIRELPGDGRGREAMVTLHFNSHILSIDGERVTAEGPAGRTELTVDTVISAIGFEQSTGDLPDRVYRAGWLASGPRGTIPMQRAASIELAARIVDDLNTADLGSRRSGLSSLALADAIDYSGWARINAIEHARATADRVRKKLPSHEQLRLASHDALKETTLA